MQRPTPSILASAILLALGAAHAAHAATTELPRTVRPSHYDITITPHAKDLDFDGHVAVDIEVLEATDRITLHARDLAFSKAALEAVGGTAKFARPKITLDDKVQTATFAFPATIAPGNYRLVLDYTGTIATQPAGLFAMDYDTAKGKRRALFTQFEAPDARAMVPSWDEPAYKATFTLTAVVPADQVAVSNMPVVARTAVGKDLASVRFAPSPKMSTYLLFLAAGDFERASMQVDGTDVGVLAQQGLAGQAAFALESSAVVLREYNDYFGTPYPLPKLDNIAAPGSSQWFSAMENWGAIFTFEHTLLLDPTISTQADRQRVFAVAAHEIAHQWFGNLVTMGWWDDLWLNEGFASWMATRTTQKLHPEWNTALGAVGSRDRAMARDAVASTHPVVQPVATVAEASQIFDAITYSKGNAVIHMLEGFVGPDAWRTGVRNYIARHAYGNTESDDLWREIEAAAEAPVLDIAHQFTLQPGVPLIRVGEAACAGGNTVVQLEQGEFTKDRPGKAPLSWQVPVIAATLGAAPARTVVTGGQATLTVPGCGPLVVNAGQSGYYRTQYPADAFARLQARFADLAPIDQLGLASDAWALGMAGLQPASDILDLIAATPVDADPQLWDDHLDTLLTLDEFHRADPARRAALRAFAIARVAPVFARVGWQARPGEPEPVINLRNNLIQSLGALGDAGVVAEARRRYAAEATDPAALPPALRRIVLGVVAEHADAATWERMHAAARAETSPLLKGSWYELLASAADESLARRALALALTDEPGATTTADMIGAVAVLHPDLAYDFAIAHRAALLAKLEPGVHVRFYPGLATDSLDAAMIGKLQAYAREHIEPALRRDTDTAIANIEYRRRIHDERLPAIDAWLQAHAAH
jgi:aminopeptidase N